VFVASWWRRQAKNNELANNVGEHLLLNVGYTTYEHMTTRKLCYRKDDRAMRAILYKWIE